MNRLAALSLFAVLVLSGCPQWGPATPAKTDAIGASRDARLVTVTPQGDPVKASIDERVTILETKVAALEATKPTDNCQLKGHKSRRCLLYVSSTPCQGCRDAKNHLAQLLAQNKGWTAGPGEHIEVRDIAQDRQCAERLGVRRVPTYIRIVDGVPDGSVINALSPNELAQFIIGEGRFAASQSCPIP